MSNWTLLPGRLQQKKVTSPRVSRLSPSGRAEHMVAQAQGKAPPTSADMKSPGMGRRPPLTVGKARKDVLADIVDGSDHAFGGSAAIPTRPTTTTKPGPSEAVDLSHDSSNDGASRVRAPSPQTRPQNQYDTRFIPASNVPATRATQTAQGTAGRGSSSSVRQASSTQRNAAPPKAPANNPIVKNAESSDFSKFIAIKRSARESADAGKRGSKKSNELMLESESDDSDESPELQRKRKETLSSSHNPAETSRRKSEPSLPATSLTVRSLRPRTNSAVNRPPSKGALEDNPIDLDATQTQSEDGIFEPKRMVTRSRVANKNYAETVLFVYPFDGACSGANASKTLVTITSDDRRTLHPREFLNDSVIEFRLRWLWHEYNTRGDFYIFSTFFYHALTKHGFRKVQKWTKDVDLFSKEVIFVPVHEAAHWRLYAIVIRLPEIFFVSLDSMSLGSHQQTAKLLTEYLQQEYEHKKESSPNILEIDPIPVHAQVPQQSNGSDCGVFMLYYVEHWMTHKLDKTWKRCSDAREHDFSTMFDPKILTEGDQQRHVLEQCIDTMQLQYDAFTKQESGQGTDQVANERGTFSENDDSGPTSPQFRQTGDEMPSSPELGQGTPPSQLQVDHLMTPFATGNPHPYTPMSANDASSDSDETSATDSFDSIDNRPRKVARKSRRDDVTSHRNTVRSTANDPLICLEDDSDEE